MKVAIVGATGVVGRTMIRILEERGFPVSELKLFASERSAGTPLKFKESILQVQPVKPNSFEGCDVALFSAGSSVSRVTAPLAVDSGCFVIDNSSAWRMDETVPLIVPEVNASALTKYLPKGKGPGIIANPNCSTIQMVVALYPLHKKFKINHIVVSTYQAVSGSGQKGIDQLLGEMEPGSFSEENAYPHQIAFNCIPHIDSFEDNGYTKEEMKMINETCKIMSAPDMLISPTCVRVPVLNGHAESIHIETEKEISPKRARQTLAKAPGVTVIDNPSENEYPTQADISGTDSVYVGRIRQDATLSNALSMWVVADNLRKGAATNAIQIAELLLKKYF